MRDTAKYNTWPLNSSGHPYQDELFVATIHHNRRGYDQSVVDEGFK